MIFSEDTRKMLTNIKAGLRSSFRPVYIGINMAKVFLATFTILCIFLEYRDSKIISFVVFFYVLLLLLCLAGDVMTGSNLRDKSGGEITDKTLGGVVQVATMNPNIDRGWFYPWAKSLIVNVLCDWTIVAILAAYGSKTTAIGILLLLVFHEILTVNAYRLAHLAVKSMDDDMNSSIQDAADTTYGRYL